MAASATSICVNPFFFRAALPPHQANLLFSHDWDSERELRERGETGSVLYVSCEGLVKNAALMEDMRSILRLLEQTYDYPVDIEFTINTAPDGSYVIDLLQCRPLQRSTEGETVTVPEVTDPDRVLFSTQGVSMGFSRKYPVDVIVYVDAQGYYKLPYREKYKVKNALSAVNWRYRGRSERLLLITPGRICTSSPELGVPSSFADISQFGAIFETSHRQAGYMPELSYGSHIFQDLVEAGILYTAVFEGATTHAFRPELLRAMPNRLADYTDQAEALKDVVWVCDAGGQGIELYYDMVTERLLLTR